MPGLPFIFRVSRLRRALRREWERQTASYGITGTQFRILWRLWEADGTLTSELARAMGVDGGTITGVLDRLEAKGLVRRERSSEDRRVVRVFLTAQARDLQRPLMRVVTELNEQALGGLSGDEQAHLVQMLERISDNLGAE